MSTTKYPSREEISRLFGHMAEGNYAAFFERVSPQVDWTVMGTHPCAGRYTSLQDFQKDTLARLGKIMKDPGIRLVVRNVIGGGDHEWATVELVANAECLNGFKFENCYSWCSRFDEKGMIVQPPSPSSKGVKAAAVQLVFSIGNQATAWKGYILEAVSEAKPVQYEKSKVESKVVIEVETT